MALSDVQLRALKPAEKPFKISDSKGLHVLVTPNGSRLWRLGDVGLTGRSLCSVDHGFSAHVPRCLVGTEVVNAVGGQTVAGESAV